MITRHYMVCGMAEKKNGSSKRPVNAHVIRVEWRQDIEDLITAFREWAGIEDDEVFVLYSITRLRGFFK